MDGTNTITVFERGNKYLYLDAGGERQLFTFIVIETELYKSCHHFQLFKYVIYAGPQSAMGL